MKNLLIIIFTLSALVVGCGGTKPPPITNSAESNIEIDSTPISKASPEVTKHTTAEDLIKNFERNGVEMDKLLTDQSVSVSGKTYLVRDNYLILDVKYTMAVECDKQVDEGPITWRELNEQASKDRDANKSTFVTFTGKYHSSTPPSKVNKYWQVDFKSCTIEAVVSK